MKTRSGKMTSRERMIAALKREDVDYAPCSPTFNPLYPIQCRGHEYQFPWNSNVERYDFCLNQLGVDPLFDIYMPRPSMADGIEARIEMEGTHLRKVLSTPAGELEAVVRADDNWPHGRDIPFFSDFNVGHYEKPWLQTEHDLECLKCILKPTQDNNFLNDWRDSARESIRTAGKLGIATRASIGAGLTGAQQLCGAEDLCFLVVDNPELIHAYLEMEHQMNLRNIELAVEAGVDIIRRNGFYETADFYGPDMLETFLGRRLREEINAVHQAGKLCAYTVHTGIMPILGYLRSLPFDCLMDIDTAFKGIYLTRVRDSQEETKSFCLGPSNTYHMWAENPEVVREAVRHVFDVFGRRGLIIKACPSVHSIMPWQNTLAMVDEWKKLR